MKKGNYLRIICEGAILVALAQVLSILKIWEFPQGGSITIGMLPIFLFCARWGTGPGLLASSAFALLQLFLDGAFAWGWQSIIGDYLLAYAVLGLAGIFSQKRYAFFYGTILGCTLRFVIHWIAGATIWAEYMPDVFFGMTMTSPWFYSALYNGSFMIIDMLLILVLGVIMFRLMAKEMTSQRIK